MIFQTGSKWPRAKSKILLSDKFTIYNLIILHSQLQSLLRYLTSPSWDWVAVHSVNSNGIWLLRLLPLKRLQHSSLHRSVHAGIHNHLRK
ncbi:hypothetical protein ACTQ50_06180 [Blautia sp. Sow4_E7]|uniref:hypothetical protein n=1 Tax=Blautia sp. Sow4_E7 TaxID=3438749 RepID=UPI003F8E3D02